MIEKYINKKITRTDLEKRMLEGNLNGEYAKLYPKKEIHFLPLLTYSKQDSLRLNLTKSKDTVKKNK